MLRAMGLVVVALAIVGYAVVSKRLSSTPLSGPLIFMVIGVLIGPSALALIHGAFDTQVIEWLLEAALALVLFTDALGISSGDWRAKSRVPLRLLVVGMPLTIGLGWAAARAILPPMDVWEAALIGLCLAPTDAALGQAVVTSPSVPELVRQALNIESGLNDGLALPFFVLALAAAAEAEQVPTESPRCS
jgi:NhaP-type Na+/H+ or K+/H+ antiporter